MLRQSHPSRLEETVEFQGTPEGSCEYIE